MGEQVEIKTQRIDFIDSLKGITIIVVVMYHLTFFYSSTNVIRYFSTPFFMQLFFFVSGMFFSSKYSFQKYFINKINRLIIPLLFFYFLNYFVAYFVSDILGLGRKGIVDKFEWVFLFNLFDGKEHFEYGGAVWFLLCLFNIYIIYYPIKKIKQVFIKFLISLIISALGFYLGSLNINVPYFIDSAMSMMIFFFLGDYLRGNKFFIQKNKFDYIIFFLSMIIYSLIINFADVYCKVMQNEYNGNFILVLLAALTGIVAVFAFSKIMKSLEIIKHFGKNTLIILGTHQILINGISVLLKKILHVNQFVGLIINLLLTLSIECFVIIFLVRFLPIFVAKKDIF
nr:acyltransferase [uncultured Flavobacterium sp.]